MLGIGRLGWLRERSTAFFQHTATLLVYDAERRDVDGNLDPRWVPGASFPCDLQERTSEAQETVEGGRVVSRSRWFCYAGTDAPGTARDRLSIRGPGVEAAEYEIVETNRARAGAQVTFHLLRLGEG